MVKKSFSLVLIVLILLQSGGLFLIYKAEQGCVHREMMRFLDNTENGFLVMTVPLAEFQQAKTGSRELCLQGILYDIKSVTYTGKAVIVHLVRDDREMVVLQKVKTLTGSSGGGQNGFTALLVKLLMADYLTPVKSEASAPLADLPAKQTALPVNTSSQHPDISTPPPEKG